MNPLPLILAELRRNAWGCAAIVALIAIAVALGATFTALERALRLAMPAAATAELQPILGYMRDFARAVPFAFDGLLVAAVLLIVATHLSARRQEIGTLRALGAPPSLLFAAVWLQVALLIVAGVVVGLIAADALARGIGAIASAELGFAVDAAIGVPELAFGGVLLVLATLFAAAPSLPLLRLPAARLLRSG